MAAIRELQYAVWHSRIPHNNIRCMIFLNMIIQQQRNNYCKEEKLSNEHPENYQVVRYYESS